jgi:Tol biopolymer transport system component
MSRFSHQLTRPSIALRAILLIGSAALAACHDDAPSPIAPPSKASTAKSGTSGKPGSVEQVLFTGIKNDNIDVYIMNADGTNLRRVTSDTTAEKEAAFSPDNKRFVYVRAPGVRSLVGDENELRTAYTDGSKSTLIVKMNASVSHPRFSPDGTKIVFSAFVSDKDFTEIFVVNADGTGLKRLTYNAGDDDMPTWSPNGQSIAWVIQAGLRRPFHQRDPCLRSRQGEPDGKRRSDPHDRYYGVADLDEERHAGGVLEQSRDRGQLRALHRHPGQDRGDGRSPPNDLRAGIGALSRLQ